MKVVLLRATGFVGREELRAEHNFEEIVGNSPALLKALHAVDQVAPTDSTVLIYGETGTGKELVARAIHSRSARNGRALVNLNCSAISAGLVESELFGHMTGPSPGLWSGASAASSLLTAARSSWTKLGSCPWRRK